MAGASLKVEIDASPITTLDKLDAALANPTALLDELGERLKRSAEGRFKAQQQPDGQPWAALSPRYLKVKPKNKNRILTLDGHLRRLTYQLDGPDAVRIGSNRVYARIHQLGGIIKPKNAKALKSGDSLRKQAIIPPRPFLGLSSQDREEITARTLDWLSGQIAG